MANDITDPLRQVAHASDDEVGTSGSDVQTPYDTTLTEIRPRAAKLLTDTPTRPPDKETPKDDVQDRQEAVPAWTWIS
jgi:hypothetical protein